MASKKTLLDKKIGKLINSRQFDFVLQSKIKAGTKHLALHFSPYELSTNEDLTCESYVNNPLEKGLSLGLIIPKRWAKSAVRRSLIKRQCRAQFALFSSILPSGGYVIRLKYGFDSSVWISASSKALKTKIKEELYYLFSKIGNK